MKRLIDVLIEKTVLVMFIRSQLWKIVHIKSNILT